MLAPLGVSPTMRGVAPHPRLRPGWWWYLSGAVTNYTPATLSSSPANSLGTVTNPVLLWNPVAINALSIYVVATNAGASAAVGLAIYDDDQGGPGKLLVNAGTASINTSAVKVLEFPAVELPAGQLWQAIYCVGLDTGGTNPTFGASYVNPAATMGSAVPWPATSNCIPSRYSSVLTPPVVWPKPSGSPNLSTSSQSAYLIGARSA